jgi:predicted signal transduction protein with EAL and GGDEF domain
MGRSLGVLHATGPDGDPPAPAEVVHLVFPGATVAETAESLERLRAALALATGTSGGPAFTASFGVADTTAGATLDEIIQAADGALLRAKELGRDRIVIAGAEGDGGHRRSSAAVAATPAG